MTFRTATRFVAAVASLLFLPVPPSNAQTHDVSAFGQLGDGDSRVRSVTLGATYGFRSIETARASPWDFYGEASVGRWFVDKDDNGRRQFTQIGLTPVLRYSFGAAQTGVFAELGIGLNVITPIFHSGDRRFSTTFNFGDHLGVGYRFGPVGVDEVALRVQHFSNGGFKNPNPGQDFVELRYARHF